MSKFLSLMRYIKSSVLKTDKRRHRQIQGAWNQNLTEELEFWRRWLTEKEFEEYRLPRLHPQGLGLPGDLITAPRGSTIEILDVGSGPVSTIGNNHPGYTINISLADPLADEYNKLLIDLGMPERACVIKASGETLLDVFSENSFDVVSCANALDHAYDPLLCIKNMLKVCKPGGWVYIISVENEGERNNYSGLHQWNFTIDDDRVKLWNRSETLFIHDHLNEAKQLVARSVIHGNELPILEIRIGKSI